MLVYGDAFWPTYTDRRQHRPRRHRLDEELHPARDAGVRRRRPRRSIAAFSARSSSTRIRRSKACRCRPSRSRTQSVGGERRPSRRPGPERAIARVEIGARRASSRRPPASAASGCCAWAAARFTASSATSTRRCRTSPTGRCTCGSTSSGATSITGRAFSDGRDVAARAARSCSDVFQSFESGSIQQVIYQMGTRMLDEIPAIAEVHLEANNRTWDTDRRARRRARRLHRRAAAVRLPRTAADRATVDGAPLDSRARHCRAACPPPGIAIELHRARRRHAPAVVVQATTNADGRTDAPLLAGDGSSPASTS